MLKQNALPGFAFTRCSLRQLDILTTSQFISLQTTTASCTQEAMALACLPTLSERATRHHNYSGTYGRREGALMYKPSPRPGDVACNPSSNQPFSRNSEYNPPSLSQSFTTVGTWKSRSQQCLADGDCSQASSPANDVATNPPPKNFLPPYEEIM